MSVHTTIFIVAVPMSELDGRAPEEILNDLNEDRNDYVAGFSRNGRVIDNLKDIVDLMPFGSDIYILGETCFLTGEQLRKSCETLESVLREIENNPGIVCTATRVEYKEMDTLRETNAEGYEPLEARSIYPPDAHIENGWVYYYTESEVLSLLSKAQVAANPEESRDDEGENLEYSFALLKSHLALLQKAISSGMGVLFYRCN